MDQHARGPLDGWPRSVIVGTGVYYSCAARGDVTTVRRPCAPRMKI
jgi:hypothetical protein